MIYVLLLLIVLVIVIAVFSIWARTRRPDSNTIVVPPAESESETDVYSETITDEDIFSWKFIKVFRSTDPNVGIATYTKKDGTHPYSDGGVSFATPGDASAGFAAIPNVYGYTYGRGTAFGNTMAPGVMGTNQNFYKLASVMDYYSRMVTPSLNSSSRVGYIYTGNNVTEVNLLISPFLLELRKTKRLIPFQGFGPLDENDSYAVANFSTWLYSLPSFTSATSPYFCTAFQVDLTNGSGYFNGLM